MIGHEIVLASEFLLNESHTQNIRNQASLYIGFLTRITLWKG